MKLSTGRVLTTHVGSLPRSRRVVDLLSAQDRGEPYDAAEFDAVMREAVRNTVSLQTDAGIDIVSDGETSKISYATYIRHRLTGFEGAPHAAGYRRNPRRSRSFGGRRRFLQISAAGVQGAD
ncbi:MAG TPA: hypothetical protein VN841_18605 [Bryobacteraceae bacterium]|nr:hypothetical protein [Bryobacteraceae bacterium]